MVGDPDANLRGGVPGVQLRVPARARTARCAGRARVRDQGSDGSTGSSTPTFGRSSTRSATLGWSRFLGAPDRRSTDHPADPQMAEGGVLEEGRMIETRGGDAAGRGDLAATRECLPSLRLRPLGSGVAATTRHGRHDRRALCGRHHRRLRAPGRRGAVSCRPEPSALAQFGLELHPDKTRLIEFGTVCIAEPPGPWHRQAGDVRLSRVHALSARTRRSGGGFVLGERRRSASGCGRSCGEIKEQLEATRHDGDRRRKADGLPRCCAAGFAYYAVPMSAPAITAFRHHSVDRWLRAFGDGGRSIGCHGGE